MKRGFRRVFVVAAAFVGVGMVGGAALAGPIAASSAADSDHSKLAVLDLPQVESLPETPTVEVNRQFVPETVGTVADIVDQVGQGLGGIKPKPLPGPTPGWVPSDLVHEAAGQVVGIAEDIGKGIGGVKPPTPPTPPGWMPPLPV